jgi:hypothetical protein
MHLYPKITSQVTIGAPYNCQFNLVYAQYETQHTLIKIWDITNQLFKVIIVMNFRFST